MSSIIPELQLNGTISSMGSLSGSISGMGTLKGSISGDISSYEKYAGPYSVEPRKVPQTLNTSDKLLVNDIDVAAIRYSEVSNPSGGLTINIGFE